MNMYKLIILLSLSLFFMGCGNGDEDENENHPPIILTDGFDEDGIYIWESKKFTFNNYVGSVGTFNYISIYPRISVRYNDGQTLNVEWKINDKAYEKIEERKYWNADKQQWEVTYISNIDKEYKFNFGDKIEVIIHIDNKIFKREISIKETRIVADIYDLKWQMSKKEVKQKEESRMKGNRELKEISPKILFAEASYNLNSLQSATVYTFENDKFIEFGEYESLTPDKKIPKDFVLLCEKLGFQNELILENGKLKESHSWNNGKVEFKIHQRDDDLVPSYIGISYRQYAK